MPIYKKVNKNFFEEWTQEMAYVLGFFAADGSMNKNKRGAYFIEFTSTDKILIKIVQSAMKSEHKISSYVSKNPKWKQRYRIQFGSKKMFSDLNSFGFTQNKSNTLKFPVVPSQYLGAFVRGYFDGDGNVYFRKHFAKDRNKERWVFQSRFTSGSLQFLKKLHKVLRRYDVNGGFISNKKGGFELVLSHRDSLALFRLMYNNTSSKLFLERKYKIFRNAIETLNMRS